MGEEGVVVVRTSVVFCVEMGMHLFAGSRLV